LAEVILAIADELGPREVEPRPVERLRYEEKNELNSMSDDFAEELSDVCHRRLGRTFSRRLAVAWPAPPGPLRPLD
jgi:hypothetical protein